MIKSVFLLQHVHNEESGEEDVKIIGIYSSRLKAESAKIRVGMAPGFRSNIGEFCIDEYKLDEDNWVEGFVD